jgi:hypothetical protein
MVISQCHSTRCNRRFKGLRRHAAVRILHGARFLIRWSVLKESSMKYPTTLRQGLLVLSVGLTALPASAGDGCDAPLNRWQSRDAVRQMAVAQGWQIQRLKIDDGCYEVRGTDAQGRSFKAKIDPETLKVLKLKQDDHPRARERDRDDRGSAQERPMQPDGAAVPPSLLTPGIEPRGQTE